MLGGLSIDKSKRTGQAVRQGGDTSAMIGAGGSKIGVTDTMARSPGSVIGEQAFVCAGCSTLRNDFKGEQKKVAWLETRLQKLERLLSKSGLHLENSDESEEDGEQIKDQDEEDDEGNAGPFHTYP